MTGTIDVFLWSLWNRDTTTGRRVILIDRFVIVGWQPSLGEDHKYKLSALGNVQMARTFAIEVTGHAETDGYEMSKGPLRWVKIAPEVELWIWLSAMHHKDVSNLYGNGLRLGTKLSAL